jgi:hypothetical protein
LTTPGHVLLKKTPRFSKYDPLVEEVELIDCNPHYAVIRLPGGREETVSVRQLAPIGNDTQEELPDSEVQDILTDPIPENDCNISPTTEGSECEADRNIPTTTPTDNVDRLYSQQQRTRPYFLRTREV